MSEHPTPLPLPLPRDVLDANVRCGICDTRAPFTLRAFRAGPVELGWQLQLTATETLFDAEPARSWRWELRCPRCAD